MRRMRRSLSIFGLVLVGVFAVGATALAEETTPSTAPPGSQVMRVIVTGELMREEPAGASLPTRGDPMPAFDATGTLRRPDEPRFLTGSHVKQRIERYGNATSAGFNLQIFDRNDLRTSRRFGGPFGASAAEMQTRFHQERYVLDLRSVAPARRMQVATQLLGPARGKQLVAEFNHWKATHP